MKEKGEGGGENAGGEKEPRGEEKSERGGKEREAGVARGVMRKKRAGGVARGRGSEEEWDGRGVEREKRGPEGRAGRAGAAGQRKLTSSSVSPVTKSVFRVWCFPLGRGSIST